MRVLAAAALLMLVSEAPAGAGQTCLPCSRTWFEGTLQGFPVPGDGGHDLDVASGDLNRDGRADVAAADGTIFVLLAHSDGIFRRGPDISPGNASKAVAIADMDGDGFLDVVAGGLGIGVTRGNGMGGFLPPSPGIGSSPPIVDLAIGDFDGDGLPDVAVVHGQASGTVRIYRGTGGGGLALMTSVPTGAIWANTIAAGDFDRDGRADLAVGRGGTSLGVEVLRNAGSGMFTPQTYLPDLGPLDIVAADLDADGDLDLAVAGAIGVGAGAQTLLGDGAGGFTPGAAFDETDLSYSIAAADFDGDGDVDLAFDEVPDRVHLARRQPDGQYAVTPANVSASVRSLAAGDWNGDGRRDLALGVDDGVLLLRPDIGQLVAPTVQHFTGLADRLIGGDFNEDGHQDLLISGGGFGTRLWLGDGAFGLANTGFQTPTPVTAIADFNLDAHLDLATANAIFLGNGAGGFVQSETFGAIAVADFDVDGRPDLASAEAVNDFSSNVVVRLGSAAGGFGAPIRTNVPIPFLSPPPGIGGFVTGRLDGDGLPDLVYLTIFGYGLIAGDGAGGFTATSTFGQNGEMRVADLNQDGYSDLLIRANGLTVRLGGPTGLGPEVAHQFPVGAGGGTLEIGDANGDGRPDVLVAGGNSAMDLAVMLTEPDVTFRKLALKIGGGGGGGAVADWNGDGRPDLAAGEVRFFAGTRCDAVALALNPTFPAACPAPGQPFSQQPAVFTMDAAGNFTCPTGNVTATLVPGSGTAGAVLSGTTTEPFYNDTGIALFHDLSVDLPGRGYRLAFTSPGLVPVIGATFSQGLSPEIAGSAFACPGRPQRYEVGTGYDSYAWRLDANALASTPTVTLDLPLGAHALTATVAQDACSATDKLPITSVLPSLTIAAVGPTTVCATCTGALVGADVTASDDAPVEWGFRTATGGPITSLAGQSDRTYRLHGSDFPGPGAYFVVASVSCGTTAVSNEVPVTIAATPSAQEIAHGALVRDDLQERPGVGAARWLLLAQEARASYEIVVEATSGDIGVAQGPLLEHVAGDAQTVLASGMAVGAGPSRSLRLVNAAATGVVDFVRVTSASCASDCGPDDTFVLRAYETSLRGSRFNNSGSQATVLILQNSGSESVQGEVHFWTAAGAWVTSQPFALETQQLLVLQTATVPALTGVGGTLTISHDGRYGSLAGKAVAIEPATGFSFDTPLTPRPR